METPRRAYPAWRFRVSVRDRQVRAHIAAAGEGNGTGLPGKGIAALTLVVLIVLFNTATELDWVMSELFA
ncbi:hypothetical protein [Streptomyces sp. NRRL S-237]|uniref:hypothetical protein n=1 Tax=Streptomyces sp. NRRL S-237 TaxID=1463895 RepID=UPI00131B008F|nr:hypothetical protein [Streptomyces sp. NRRL S-237]